jgi:hypothetical protein
VAGDVHDLARVLKSASLVCLMPRVMRASTANGGRNGVRVTRQYLERGRGEAPCVRKANPSGPSGYFSTRGRGNNNPSFVLSSDVFEASKGTDAYTIGDFGNHFLYGR